MASLLLVDDDCDQLETRKILLEAAGHRVMAAREAASAYSAFQALPVDIVVMDLRLPCAQDGLGLIRTLRAQAPTVKILVLSGWLGDFAEQPEASMVDGCARKPVRSADLLRLISELSACG